MANLIIKSSADNLVLQGSDASPAITVGVTGTTTFAENATLSGTANALGTVTSGNISNTAIVYPDGHTLQTKTNVITSKPTTTATSHPGTTTGLAVGITPSSASNKILISVYLGMASTTSSTSGTVAFTMYSSLTSGTIGNGEGLSTRVGTAFRHASNWNNDANHGFGAAWAFADTPSSWTSGEITYTLYFWVEASGGPGWINRSGGHSVGTNAYQSDTSSTIIAQEIKA